MPPQSPIDIKDPVLRLSVSVDGKALEEYYPVLSLEIEHAINRVSSAELSIVFGGLATGDFNMEDNDKLAPGKTIEMKAAWGGDGAETSIFTGSILKKKIQVKSAGSYTLLISCSHDARKMTFNKNPSEFTNKSDSDIIKAIAGLYSVQCKIDATAPVMETMIKTSGASDWDFILSRSEFNGQVIISGVDGIHIGIPSLSSAPVLRVAFGESIYSFNAEINMENQPATVTAKALKVGTDEELEVNAKEPDLQEPLKTIVASTSQRATSPVLKSNVPMTRDELQAWADGRLLRMRLSAMKGDISFIGNAAIKPGDMMELAGIGSTYNGNVYVSSVKHNIQEGSWTTTIKFGLDDKLVTQQKDFAPPPAGGQLPSIQGLQMATVKKLSGDPKSEYRIQILFPSQSDNPQPVWARVANFYGSNQAGAVFFPEVGDQVVAGFFESDPRYPVVLGSLYNTTNASPVPMKDENNYSKALITKSKIKISFDDEKKILKMETPGGNMITFSDEDKSIVIKDQNGNTINMGSGGIELKTDKDISLKATGNINLDATGKLNLTAKQDAAIKGMNINHTADIGFTAKGNASAELSATGQTTVKGSLVMIN